MAALPMQGKCQPARGPGSQRGAPSPSPESSLTWCLSHLSKPGLQTTEEPGNCTEDSGVKSSKESDKRSKAAQWRALVAIRTHHIKGGTSGISRFRTQGGLGPLLNVLKDPECSRKTLDLALSILANCCTELATRVQVRKLDGVAIVVDILKRNVTTDTVQNRAARALGNLAMDPQNSSLIHSSGGVPLLLHCLSLCSSSSSSSPSRAPPPPSGPQLECAQSAARALLYLADTQANRLSLVMHGAVTALAPLMAAELPQGLRRAALRAVHELTRGCGMECAREVSRSGVLAPLGAMATGEPPEELALKALANLCTQGCLRPLVGSLDVIRCFSQEARREPLKSAVFLKALCLCCKEAVNRAKVKECGGLETLVGFLAAHRGHPLARMAIVACVDFVYDEAALEQLQELGLVPMLVARLAALAREEEEDEEEEVAAAEEVEPPADRPDVGLTSGMSPSELLSSSCFESFDFPALDSSRREESREQGPGSSSFLSLRSWLLSEGLISSEGDLIEAPGAAEGDWSGLHLPSSSSSSSLPQSAPALISASPSAPKSSSPSPSPSSCTRPALLPSVVTPGSAHQLEVPSLGDPTAPAAPAPGPRPLSSPTGTPQTPVSPSKFSPQRKRPRIYPLPRPTPISPDAPPFPSPPPGSSASLTPTPASLTPTTPTPASLTPTTPTPQRPHPHGRHPYHPEPWAPESPVLLLLSRFSHAPDPSAALVTPTALRGLLRYVSRHPDPSSRCFRLLGRLSCNPNCLHALVRTGAPALIRHHLCRPAERGGGAGGGVGGGDGGARQTGRVRARVKQLGLSLLNNMRVQCESAFGSGVLAHAILSGSEPDKMNCALSLPLVNSNKALLKKLLLDSGGLTVALQPLGSNMAGGDNDDHSMDCGPLLPKCFSSSPPATASQLHSLYLSLLIGCLSSLVGGGSGADAAGKPPAGRSGAPKHPEATPPPSKRPRLDAACPYRDATFDLLLELDDGTRLPANRAVVSEGSEYFRALLGGGFEEASGAAARAIPIRDVSGGSLLTVLHHLHGCRLAAPPWEEGQAPQGGCQVLGALAGETPGLVPGGGAPEPVETQDFQDSPLGQAMVGACRFLVAALQREAEELCVELLLAQVAAPPPRAPPGRPAGESTDEGLARRASALELSGGAEAGARRVIKEPEGPVCVPSSGDTDGSSRAAGYPQTASDPDLQPQEPKPLPGSGSGSKDKTRPGPKNSRRPARPAPLDPSSAALWALLPQLYRFSQRYSYPVLGRACLSVLLGAQRGPRPHPRPSSSSSSSSSSSPGDCLGRLAMEADCAATLKRDLLDLVTLVLS